MPSPQPAEALSSSPGASVPRSAEVRPPWSWSLWAVNAAAAGVLLLLSLQAGRWVGQQGSSTVLAALPALLLVVVLPPLAVVGVDRWRSRGLGMASTRGGAAVGAGLGLQLLMLVAAIAVGAS